MRKEFELEVVEKRAEAKDAVTLKFLVPADLIETFKFQAGQFVGLTASISGEEVHRSYSISSSPHEDGFFEVSIKKVENGKMSTYLVDVLKKGENLKVTPPAGKFYKEHENKKHHIMFAAGSGVTPMISIIKHLKLKKPDDMVTLFYWNQSLESTMFKKVLEDLSQDTNLNLFLSFTRQKEDHPNLGFLERVGPKVLKDCYYKWSISMDMPTFYLCGPEEFMKTIEGFLGTKGYDTSQIRKESFDTTLPKNLYENKNDEIAENGDLLIGDKSVVQPRNSGGLCEAVLDGDLISVEPEEDETILEAFLRSGESPPYSCMEGTCIACQCKVLEGVVEMPKDSFISEDEINEGLVLSCQAQIRSKKVKVDFDDI